VNRQVSAALSARQGAHYYSSIHDVTASRQQPPQQQQQQQCKAGRQTSCDACARRRAAWRGVTTSAKSYRTVPYRTSTCFVRTTTTCRSRRRQLFRRRRRCRRRLEASSSRPSLSAACPHRGGGRAVHERAAPAPSMHPDEMLALAPQPSTSTPPLLPLQA